MEGKSKKIYFKQKRKKAQIINIQVLSLFELKFFFKFCFFKKELSILKYKLKNVITFNIKTKIKKRKGRKRDKNRNELRNLARFIQIRGGGNCKVIYQKEDSKNETRTFIYILYLIKMWF